MAWSLLLRGPHPSTYQRRPSLPPPQPSSWGPILSRCEMCNSRGWHPSTPGREKGQSWPPFREGPGPGPAGGKAGWKEALVRHGAWGGKAGPQMFLLLRPQRQESSVGRREAASIPLAALGSPPGNRPQPKGALDLCSCSSQRPPPGPGHYCFSAAAWGGGWAVPLPGHSEPNDRHGRQPECCPHL